jgi:hypothetical protein
MRTGYDGKKSKLTYYQALDMATRAAERRWACVRRGAGSAPGPSSWSCSISSGPPRLRNWRPESIVSRALGDMGRPPPSPDAWIPTIM